MKIAKAYCDKCKQVTAQVDCTATFNCTVCGEINSLLNYDGTSHPVIKPNIGVKVAIIPHGDVYSMCASQFAQIDCRVQECLFYKGAGNCSNASPAITLNPDGKFVCWSKKTRV